jgi:Zn-dependent metalloprotease
MSTICLLMLFTSAGFAQVPAKEQRRNLMQDFNQRYNNRWEIQWSEATGTPAAILGYKLSAYSGTPEQIVRQFLHDEKGMLGIESVDKNLKLEVTRYTSRGGTCILFTQVYQGVPVLNSGYLVAVDDDKNIYYLSGDYYPEVSLNVSPVLLASDIVKIVESDLAGSTIEKVSDPVLSILAEVDITTEKYTLVYRVEATTSQPIDIWRYTINANDGSMIEKISLIEKVNGNGDVYLTNPLHGSIVNRIIHGLRDISPRKLDGDNAIVLNDSTSEASSPSGSFVYSASNTHFDEVMAYYHGDEFERWLIGKGMETGRVGKVTIHTENLSYYAAANSSSRIIYFSDGEAFPGLRNPTREAAVIVHEYMHVVSQTYNSLDQNSRAEAMDEAYSDYFGLAYTNQFFSTSTMGEYIDEPGGKVYRRELINSNMWEEFETIDLEPNYVTEEHDRCVIFSGALWDFRRDSDVSSSIADELVLESLIYLDSYPEFYDGRNALKTAAIASGYSQYTDDIDAAFNNHHIYPPVTATISGPSGLYYQQWASWWVTPSGGTGSYTYQWSVNLDGSGTWQDLGTAQIQYYQMGTVGFTLRCVVTSGGQYASPGKYVAYLGGLRKEKTEEETALLLPTEFELEQNYPNPFNPETVIQYALPENGYVTLSILNVMGQSIRTVVNAHKTAGYHNITWDGRDESGAEVASGIYFYRILVRPDVVETSQFEAVRKMTLLQ